MRMRVKICGITNRADAELAATLGADAIGLNAYAQSPRHVNPKEGFAIVHDLAPFVQPVVIFVNETMPVAERVVLDYGREPFSCMPTNTRSLWTW